MLKRRAFPESVALNMSEDACPPRCSLPGHAWESVRHDPMVTWLCSWNENVLNSNKYVMLAASSSFKGKSDTDKYQKAIRLKSCIGKVRPAPPAWTAVVFVHTSRNVLCLCVCLCRCGRTTRA